MVGSAIVFAPRGAVARSRPMSAIAGITACLLASLTFTRAPVPPDPLARGYMGIQVQTGGVGIEYVEPNSPAAKAGLQQGDAILRIGKLEPHEHTQIVAHICSFRPGAIIEIEVKRGMERRIVHV